MKLIRRIKAQTRLIRRLVRHKIKAKPMPITVAVCAFVAMVMVLIYLTSSVSQRSAKWSSISSVRVDFNLMVTNRVFILETKGDAVKAELQLKEMYFYENDFVFPFRGRLSCSKGTTDCSMEVRAPVRFEPGEVYAGDLQLSAFTSHGLDLGTDKEFVAATLFMRVKEKLDILPFKVDKDFKAIHAIYNDFIEFEK